MSHRAKIWRYMGSGDERDGIHLGFLRDCLSNELNCKIQVTYYFHISMRCVVFNICTALLGSLEGAVALFIRKERIETFMWSFLAILTICHKLPTQHHTISSLSLSHMYMLRYIVLNSISSILQLIIIIITYNQ